MDAAQQRTEKASPGTSLKPILPPRTSERWPRPRHVLETHSSTEDVGKMAAAAKVKTLVLSHLVGGAGPRGAAAPADPYTSDIKRFFDGEVIVGRDQMRI
jgi:ribonuclease BN (tRNA processing enzyme)